MTPGPTEHRHEPVRVQHEPDSKALVVLARRWALRDPTISGIALLGGLVAGAASGTRLVLQDAGVDGPGGPTDIVVARLTGMIVPIFTGVALAAYAAQVSGQDVTAGRAWGLLRGRWTALLAWVVTSALVIGAGGAVLVLLPAVGPILFLAGYAAWWFLTLYALPAAVLSGELPHRALVTSLRLVRDTFSFTIGANVRALFPWLPCVVGAFAVEGFGYLVWDHYRGEVPTWSTAGLLVMLAAQLCVSCSLAMQSAVTNLVNTMVLRHDRGFPTPGLTPYQLPTRWTA